MVRKLCQFWREQSNNFCNNRYKTLCPVGSLLTNDNANLLQQLIWGFKWTTYWNKYQSKVTTERQNQYLDYLIDPGFYGISRLYVLSFEGVAQCTGDTGYFLPEVEIKDYHVMIDGKNLFRLLVKNDIRTFEKLQLVRIDDDHRTGFLLGYPIQKSIKRW